MREGGTAMAEELNEAEITGTIEALRQFAKQFRRKSYFALALAGVESVNAAWLETGTPWRLLAVAVAVSALLLFWFIEEQMRKSEFLADKLQETLDAYRAFNQSAPPNPPCSPSAAS
jgi:hypothetical protein